MSKKILCTVSLLCIGACCVAAGEAQEPLPSQTANEKPLVARPSQQKKRDTLSSSAEVVALRKQMAALEQEFSNLKRQFAVVQAKSHATIQVDGVIARNAEVDNAVLEVALEHKFGAETGKRVISQKDFPTFVPHNPHFVMGDLDRIQQEYDKAGLNFIDDPRAYDESRQRAFPGSTSSASADLPHYCLDGTALITLHYSLGYHPGSADFEMKKQGNQWKITKYSSWVTL
jgi:hypothetical protein